MVNPGKTVLTCPLSVQSLQPEVMVASGSNEGWTVRTAIMNNPASRSTESFTIPAPPMHSELVPHGRVRLLHAP